MSKNEGFEKAVDFLKRIMIKQEAGEAFWA
jgi:hypothetical protein